MAVSNDHFRFSTPPFNIPRSLHNRNPYTSSSNNFPSHTLLSLLRRKPQIQLHNLNTPRNNNNNPNSLLHQRPQHPPPPLPPWKTLPGPRPNERPTSRRSLSTSRKREIVECDLGSRDGVRLYHAEWEHGRVVFWRWVGEREGWWDGCGGECG